MKPTWKQLVKRGTQTGRFEAAGEVVPVSRRVRDAQLEELKGRLLRQQLAENQVPGLSGTIRRAADEAASLAWSTPYPLLVFPELFLEKLHTAKHRAGKQASVVRRSAALLAAT